MPSPGNPQALNRYAYAVNNPVRYTDPSGHFTYCDENGNCADNGYSVDNPAFTSYEASERRYQLLLYNNALAQWARNGWITDLDAFEQLANAAASMIPGDINGGRTKAFVNDLGAVLHEYARDSELYYEESTPLGQSGFAAIFQDPGVGGHQPHHFWFYVWLGFRLDAWAGVGNLAHETFLTAGTFSFGELVGRSYQDFALGQEGISLGTDLMHSNIDINQVGGYIQNRLGTGTQATRVWGTTYSSGRFNKKVYDLCLSASAVLWPIPEGAYQPR